MKILASLLTALIFNFMFLVGLKMGYIDKYGIEVYFNAFFSKNQPLSYVAFLLPTLVAFYLPQKAMLSILAVLTIIAHTTFFFAEPIGKKLYSEVASYKIGKHDVTDITLLYSQRGVDYVYFKNSGVTKIYETKNRVK